MLARRAMKNLKAEQEIDSHALRTLAGLCIYINSVRKWIVLCIYVNSVTKGRKGYI